MLDLIEKIAENLQKDPLNYRIYKDLYSVAKEALKTDKELGLKWLKWISERLNDLIPSLAKTDLPLARNFFSLHKQVLHAAAKDDFDSYLLYIEWNREPSKKFYAPRRKVLKAVVDELQALADDALDLLAISLPPGVGKTTLAIFFLTWLAGKIPDKPMLTGSHSNSFVRGVYDEYDEDELRRYFDLPSTTPDGILAVCDTKDKGTDYAVLPVGYGYLIADGLTTALSTFIVGKVMRNAFGAQAGQYWAVAALTISAGTTIKAIYDHVVEHGFDSNTIVSAIWAAIKGGAAGGSLALALGTSVIGGIAVGAAITLGVGVIVALVASEVRDSAMQKLVMWGKLTLTANEIKKTAEGLFEFDITPRINLLAGVIENTKVAKEALSTTTELFNANLKKVEIGAQIDPDLKEELTNQLTGEDGLIPKIKSLLSESENQLTLR